MNTIHSFSLESARLYGILDLGYVARPEALGMALKMLAGQVSVLQLRWKGGDGTAIEALGRDLLPLTQAAGVPLVINDYPEIAGRIGAAGTHLGQEDGPLDRAREKLGPGAWIGRSTHSLAQAEAAEAEGADYIGFGPIFATPTKPDYQPIGMDDIAEVHRRVKVPIFCIGGIKWGNLAQVMANGAQRVVIVSEFLQAPDVEAYGRRVVQRLNSADSSSIGRAPIF